MGKIENGNYSQAARIDSEEEREGANCSWLIQVENAQKFIVQKKFSFFFADFAKQRGKAKKNFHLPDGCCFLLWLG